MYAINSSAEIKHGKQQQEPMQCMQ